MSSPPFTELCPPSADGRSFTMAMRPGLGDCAPSGRMRLDALARWLQDVAYADVEDAGLAAHAFWVVRRTRIRVRRWPRFGEHFSVQTFCTGLGRMWAERRTVIAATTPGGAPSGLVHSNGAAVETVALWVHLDPSSRRPEPFAAEELEAYGPPAARRVSARLRHPGPPSATARSDWTFRATDCDIAGHVNNAAYWLPVEEELLGSGTEPAAFDCEMEFRAGTQPGKKVVLAQGPMRWIVGAGDDVHASVALDPALPRPPR